MPANFQTRAKLVEAARKLTSENIKEIKYILKDDIGEGTLENICNGTELFDLLEKEGIIRLSDLKQLIEILDAIGRHDIVELLTGQKIEKKTIAVKQDFLPPDASEPNELSPQVLDYIANLLAGDWKRNARFLNIAEHEIEQIDYDCRRTYDKCMRSLTSWMKSNDNLTWGLLKEKSLIRIPRYDIIRNVEKIYPNLVNCPQKATTSYATDTYDSATSEVILSSGSKLQHLSKHSKGVQDTNELVEQEGGSSSLNDGPLNPDNIDVHYGPERGLCVDESKQQLSSKSKSAQDTEKPVESEDSFLDQFVDLSMAPGN